MGKKSECVRVPILLRMDNPRHQLVYVSFFYMAFVGTVVIYIRI